MKKSKIILLFLILVVLELTILVGYPKFAYLVRHNTYSISYYNYHPAKTVVSEVDTSKMPPAQAVPILMYHGVLAKKDNENTTIASFISQMEMLKRNGYQTITLEQFDNFLNGKYTLPAKPIIITFDDGRKDSYYTTDDILKKLGFIATLFEVSGKPDQKDRFYLSWAELKKMQESGRWDIQAHGTFSHDKFVIDASGTIGRFLSSKIYYPNTAQLESTSAFNTRVENDYIQNIRDLKDHLGIDPKYFAIPLNDYGEKPVSNYPGGIPFNNQMITKYFSMAFIEANDAEDVTKFNIDIYNYQDSDRYKISRIEVQNMSADFLKQILDYNAPKEPGLTYVFSNDNKIAATFMYSYGNFFYRQDGFHVTTEKDTDTARLIFGELRWKNYAVEANLERVFGRSAAIIGHFEDTNNYVTFGMTDNTVFIREYIDGQEVDLFPSLPYHQKYATGFHTFRMEFLNGTVTAKIDNQLMFWGITVNSLRGRVGIKVWGDTQPAETIIQSFKIEPII